MALPSGPPPAKGGVWSAALPAISQGQQQHQQRQDQPFGQNHAPRPPGVAAPSDMSMPLGARGGAFNDFPRSTSNPAFGKEAFGKATFGNSTPSNSVAVAGVDVNPQEPKSDSHNIGGPYVDDPHIGGQHFGGPPVGDLPVGASVTNPVAAAVAKRLLSRGEGNGGGTRNAVPHVSSVPLLRAEGWTDNPTQGEAAGESGEQWEEGGVSTPKVPSPEVGAEAGAEAEGGSGKGAISEQAPKSEPRKDAKKKVVPRRASVGGQMVAGKPGRLAKMMSKWLYPDAKVIF